MNTRLLREVYNLAKASNNLDIMLKAAYALPDDSELELPSCDVEPDDSDDLPESITTLEDFLIFLRDFR